jgi:Flp pilus assembly protein protease CpaA
METESARVLAGVAIALAGTAVAAYTDVKTGYVYEWLTAPMIAAGALLTLLSFNVALILQTFAVAFVVFAAGYLSYRAGQLGGGDVLLFAALSLLVPFSPFAKSQIPPILLVFMLSGVFCIAGVFATYLPKVARDIAAKKAKPAVRDIASAAAIFASIAALWMMSSRFGLSAAQAAVFAVILVPGSFLVAFKTHIANSMVKRVPVSKIEEEDVLALERMDERIVKKYGLRKLLTKAEIEKLKRIRETKRFPVYMGLPRFVPYILAALVASLFFGDALFGF